ncbi:MAG: hypothetical protein R6U96_02320 [Promethearchaeia archaeon]
MLIFARRILVCVVGISVHGDLVKMTVGNYPHIRFFASRASFSLFAGIDIITIER